MPPIDRPNSTVRKNGKKAASGVAHRIQQIAWFKNCIVFDGRMHWKWDKGFDLKKNEVVEKSK